MNQRLLAYLAMPDAYDDFYLRLIGISCLTFKAGLFFQQLVSLRFIHEFNFMAQVVIDAVEVESAEHSVTTAKSNALAKACQYSWHTDTHTVVGYS